MLVDDFLGVYDVSRGVATVVDADIATTWDALLDADLIDVGRKRPLGGVLGAIRMLPDMVGQVAPWRTAAAPAGASAPARHETLPLGKGGWVLLGQRPRDEIALGLIGTFWRPVIEFASVTADQFRELAEPGYAKTVYSLSARLLGERRTLLSGAMRTATTDEHARRSFRRYRTFDLGWGAHILVNGLLDVTRATAEAHAGVPRS